MKNPGYGQPLALRNRFAGIMLSAIALALSCIAISADAATVIRGPYLQTVTPNSVIVRWRTDVATDARVRFGTASGALTSSAQNNVRSTNHSVQLTGLTPATRYYYDIGTSAAKLAGNASFSFVSAPTEKSQRFVRIWVTGDPGTADAGARSVRDGFVKFAGSRPATLWLMLGDNAYEDGTDADYQKAVFNMYPQQLRSLPLYSAFGNHEGHSANSSNESGPYYQIFSFPRNGQAGGLASGTEAYYSFDYGKIHFIALDSYGSDDSADGPMMTWLKADLAATNKDWVIAFWHHPPYSKGSHDSDLSSSQTAMRQIAARILENHGVDLVLSGHRHAYERSYLIDGHYGKSTTFDSSMIVDSGDGSPAGSGAYRKSLPLQPHQGTVYVAAGNAGRTSSSGDLNHPAMLVNSRQRGSLVLDLVDNRLEVRMINPSGNVADYFAIVKGADKAAPQIRSAEATTASVIKVAFSEPVTPKSGSAVANYTLVRNGYTAAATGVQIATADVAADGRSVTLRTSAPLVENSSYTLSVRNISDADNNVIQAGASAVIAYAATATAKFQNGSSPDGGYAGTADTYLAEVSPDRNFGYATTLEADGDDAGLDMGVLLRWDLSAIPASAVVQSAAITVRVTGSTVGSYNLYALSRGWSQSGATWLRTGLTGPWGKPGATGANDHEPDVLAVWSNLGTGSSTIPLNNKGLETLQAWISGSRPNNGFLLYDPDTTDGLRIASSETSDPAARPQLKIVYTTDPAAVAPGLPYDFRTVGVAADGIWIAWSAPADGAEIVGYRVWVNGVDMGNTATPEYKALKLEPSTQYNFSVTSIAIDGSESAKAGYKASTLASAAGSVSASGWQSPSSGGGGTANIAPKISGSPSSLAQVGKAYSFRPTASDPDNGPGKLAFSIANKPAWATFDTTSGALSGVPGVSDIATTKGIRISVSDGAAAASLAAFDLVVQSAPSATSGGAGTVKFFVDAKSDFDTWTKSPSEDTKAWMRDHYFRMQTYSGYFDSRLTWYPNAWVYKDSYALKPGWSVTQQHPEWILRDADGSKLYIPFGCSGGTCPQYAADIGNQNFRNWWMDSLSAVMNSGYIGVWVDDVNLKWKVGNGDGNSVIPMDSRTGARMTYADYQRYFAEFMEQVRARFPDAEIAHNIIWSTVPADGDKQFLTREVQAADYINLERGVSDKGIKGGSGTYGFETFLKFIDWVHSLGRNVILDDDDSTSVKDRDYELATYFLINNGNDLLGADGDRSRMNPDNFWSGYSVNLGAALGQRYLDSGVFRRDFKCGVVLVNQPEQPDRTIALAQSMTDLNGRSVRSVTLTAAEGEVLIHPCQ